MKRPLGSRSRRRRHDWARVAMVGAFVLIGIAVPNGGAAARSDDVLFVPALGRGGIPTSGVSAVVATVTAVDPSSAGYVTVFECAAGLPDTSNLNISANAVPNTAVVPIGSDGMICVYRSTPMQVIVDVTGWISTDADAHPIRPIRSLDTRSGVGARAGRVGPGERVRLQVGGGVIPQHAAGVIANITATAAVNAGFLTVFPCDVGDQGTSNVNFGAGVDVANLAVLSLDADGAVCVESSAPTHVIIDVSAWVDRSDAISVVPPTRLVDTRQTSRVGTGAPLVVRVSTDGSVSTMLNVTSTRQFGAGFLTVYPCDTAVPTTSSVNFVPGADSAAAVLAKPSSDGHVCIQSSADTDVVVDLQATATAGSGIRSVTPVRLVDTRSPANLAPSAASTRRTISQAEIHNGVTLDDVLARNPTSGLLSSIRQGSITVSLSWRGVGSANETVMQARHGATTLWEQVVVPIGRPESQLIIRASDPTTVYAVELIGTCSVGCSWYTTEGRLHAYELSTGARRWVVPLGTTDDPRSVAVGDGLVLVGDGSTVRAFDAATGADRWNRAAATGTNQFGLGAVGQRVTVSEAQMTPDGRVQWEVVRRLDPSSGLVSWERTIGIRSTCQGPSVVYAGPTGDLAVNLGIATALNAADGTILWSRNLEQALGVSGFSDQRSLLTPDGDLVVLLSLYGDTTVGRLDGQTGALEWRWEFRSVNQTWPTWRTVPTLDLAMIGDTVVLGATRNFIDANGIPTSQHSRTSIVLRAGDGARLV